jgi:hypothetical protein
LLITIWSFKGLHRCLTAHIHHRSLNCIYVDLPTLNKP